MIPEYGSVRLPLSELLGDEEVVRVLLLNPGRDYNDASLAFHGSTPRSGSIAAA